MGRSGSLGVGRVGQVARGPPNRLAVIRIEIITIIIIIIIIIKIIIIKKK